MVASMRRHQYPVWRDYLATEETNGAVRVLGAFSAKVGHAFETAAHFWPEPFTAGRGRIASDERPGLIWRSVSHE